MGDTCVRLNQASGRFMSKIPARCNRRECQARRNLSKRPELYVRWPTCHYLHCKGKMYVDEYRLRRGPKDHAPTCYMNCLPYPHRLDTPECDGYQDYVDDRDAEPKSRHCPNV